MSRKLLLSSLAVLIAGGAIILSFNVNKQIARSCVTQDDANQSLQHFFRYGLLSDGESVLLPRSVAREYQQLTNCLANNRSWVGEGYFVELLDRATRLQMVEDAYEDDDKVCFDFITGGKVCSQ
tara:strand:+ start:62 stop:433 length:372 start_codon:yes stop_codon:yes gene_type:complete